MNENIKEYIAKVGKLFGQGISTEHSYRGDLQVLLKSLFPEIGVTNEPRRQKCGAPDYIIQIKDVPIGYIEAKDIAVDLNKTEKSEQMERYLASLQNLILTDYLEFRFYRNGIKIESVKLAVIEKGKVKIIQENIDKYLRLIEEFCRYRGQTIKSSEKLAVIMAKKARMMEEVIYKAVTTDDDEDNSLKDQLKAFRQILIHDLGEKTFADIYSQTIAYGMFAARLHDKTLDTFSRQEARELIPKTNPFLRNLFDYISGVQLDDRVVWIVDDLSDIFRATDLNELLKDFGSKTGQNDPFLHFYETFLAEYDPALRKSRGVFYTPEPVVGFIVRAVDDILKEEFGISQGLACTEKIKIKLENDIGKMVEKEVHKVQILDPATGTGTFLAEVVKHIYKSFKGQEGIWSNYVTEHLIPRLNGFEILMASYTVCHLKLELLLQETGYKPKDEAKINRLRVFLTNSLEEPHPDTGTLFASWLSREATEANAVKRDTPVMVVIGNPPYSGESANKGEWIMKLMEDYKKEPGGVDKLDERNPKWINDDYMKFIRFGQYFIEKNGEGILAYINPHGFLDNPTFRGVRWNLLKTFDKIYTIDLHGNSKKKEVCPDGTPDENVFDIQQGVSINLFIKTGKKKKDQLGKIFHFDLFGKREDKYTFLNSNSIKTVPYKLLENTSPNYFFVSKDFDELKVYNEGFSVVELFPLNSVGIVTARDEFTIHDSKESVKKVIQEFLSLDNETARIKFNLGKDVRDWQVQYAKDDLNKSNLDYKKNIVKITYRPFDDKYTYFTGKSKGFHCMPRGEIMKHFIKGENIGLIIGRQGQVVGSMQWNLSFITKELVDLNMFYRGGEQVFPLYLYPDDLESPSFGGVGEVERKPNLNPEIVGKIAEKLGTPPGLPKGEEETPPDLPKGEEETPPDLPKGEEEKKFGYITANANSYRFIKERRDELKNNQTEAESVLWEYLRNKKTGFKIRRQHIIGNFIVDFVCLVKKLVIEVDGEIHNTQKEYDEERSKKLNELGYKVIRFNNKEVLSNTKDVCDKIQQYLEELPDLIVSPPLEGSGEVFSPLDILDYIYAVLHSPKYREKYKEFLKIDFPRVPYPENKEIFWQMVKYGGELRKIHLLEHPVVNNLITTYPINGNNTVDKIHFDSAQCSDGTGKIWINATQYFDKVPEVAWNFYIGGYQPAQKWLKDRKGRTLGFEDILHYQKIIIALNETARIMGEIDGE